MEYGLIGEKLGHSYSPRIHQALGSYPYTLCPLPAEKLGEFLSAKNFRGLNVTIPYKKAVLPYCDRISEVARRIGSVNTLLRLPDNSLYGHNTDYEGFLRAVHASKIDFSGKKVLILGSGGASLAVRAASEAMGAREIVTVSRQGPVDYQNVFFLHEDAEILINATPVGMYPDNGRSPISLRRLPALSAVIDLIYNPQYTALLLEAKELGLSVLSGLPMLVAQARASAELFLGRALSEESERRILRELSAESANIVLIGMPGCGKSTVGRIVAARMGREFVDLDEKIVLRAGIPVPRIFALHGEARFRELESLVLAEEGRTGGRVLACGGGVVLRRDNYPPLKQNGRIYHLERAKELLARTGRPLSSSPEAVARMERERAPLYRRFCDVSIDNNIGSPEQTAEKITEEFYEYFYHQRP